MRVKFSLPLKPFSVNQMFYGRSNGHTAAYRDWEMKCFYQLAKAEPQAALKAIREAFNPEKHALIVRLTFLYPRAIFYTKEGLASGRCFDLTNVEKPLQDVLCGAKFHIQALPYGCPNLNLDDKHIISLQSRKRVSINNEHQICVQIAIVEKLA